MFDSGFGGLTVARAVIDLLPSEDLVYLGDTGRYPYGPRPREQVVEYSRQIAAKLASDYDVKVVVVACNTASASALEALRTELEIPVIGVIEPGVRAALRATRNGRIGVIGTVGTISSGAYQRVAREQGAPESLKCAATPGFVEFVERGETQSDQVYVLAERLLSPLRDAGVDTLLLGCTHYPFLARTIGDVMGRDVVLVSSADETAFELAELLSRTSLTKVASGSAPGESGVGNHRFLSSGDVSWFKELGAQLLGPELDGVEPVSWGPEFGESLGTPR